MIRIGLIGFGYWGPNLLRNFQSFAGTRVVAVADRKLERLARLSVSDPDLRLTDDAASLIDDPDIDAVAIATPVATHYPFARDAIERGKHVLIEKPMTMTADEAADLTARAERRGVTLMVDHTFLFNGSVRHIRDLVKSGELGDVSYIDSLRVNLGLFQPDVNVLWDLAPHDLSIIDFILGQEPIHIEATGHCHVNAHLPDIAYLTLHFPSNVVAHLNLSWMSPIKVRRTAIGGTRKMLVWDDLNMEEKVKIYACGIEFQPEEQRSVIIPEYRIGDIYSPRIPKTEPLAGVVRHFAAVVRGEEASVMDGRQGLRVVKVLEQAQAALDRNLREVSALRGLSQG
jgi:predicted dehydrogenase